MQSDVEVIVRDRITISDHLFYMESGNNNPGHEKVNIFSSDRTVSLEI